VSTLTSAVAVCGSHLLDRVPQPPTERISAIYFDHERSSPCIPSHQSGPPLFCFGKCWPRAANAQTSGSGECVWIPLHQSLLIGVLLTLVHSVQRSILQEMYHYSFRKVRRTARAEKQVMSPPTMCNCGIDACGLLACHHCSTKKPLTVVNATALSSR
jgi:hypothetical protein